MVAVGPEAAISDLCICFVGEAASGQEDIVCENGDGVADDSVVTDIVMSSVTDLNVVRSLSGGSDLASSCSQNHVTIVGADLDTALSIGSHLRATVSNLGVGVVDDSAGTTGQDDGAPSRFDDDVASVVPSGSQSTHSNLSEGNVAFTAEN